MSSIVLVEPASTKGATPYVTFASPYDTLLGDRFFVQLRRVFERLVHRYRIRFTSVADVACGTGTFVRYLRQRGVPFVYGVDRSLAMLHVAVAKNRGTGAHFLLQDFSRLQLPRRADLITCNFDSLNYLLTTDDLLCALRRFHTNLRPGGHAIFDLITDRPPWHGSQPRVERVSEPGSTIVRVTRWDRRRSTQTAIISISRNGHMQQEIHVQRGYPVAMVVGMLAQAQFALLGAHDFYTLGPATVQTSRVVYVAQRA